VTLPTELLLTHVRIKESGIAGLMMNLTVGLFVGDMGIHILLIAPHQELQEIF
tara:strand:+ start:56 stop:214 length:159 start_codon:yes stop_codon:yes gene_type:complete